jgi:RNA polymerase sigma factor (sigma-70 family)
VIHLEELDGLPSYINAAKFLLVYTNNQNLVSDEDAVSRAIEAIVFSKKEHNISQGSLFNFTIQNVRKFINRYLVASRKNIKTITHCCAKSEDNPLSILINDELKERINNIIQNLSGNKQICAKLFYHYGFTVSEIARSINITPQGVSYILRSLKKEFYVLQKEKEYIR